MSVLAGGNVPWVELQEKGERLSNSTGSTENCDFRELEDAVSFGSSVSSSPMMSIVDSFGVCPAAPLNLQHLPLRLPVRLADSPNHPQSIVSPSMHPRKQCKLRCTPPHPDKSSAKKEKMVNSHPEQRLRKPATGEHQSMIVVQRT